MRSDTIFLAGEPPRAWDAIKWNLEKTSYLTSIAGFYWPGDLMDASASERAQWDSAFMEARPSRFRAMRRIPDSRAPPTEKQPKGVSSFKEVDIFTAVGARKSPKVIGGISRPRQAAVNMFSEASRDGRAACLP